MNSKVYRSYFIILAAILATMISGCNFSKVKLGEVRVMYGDNEDGRIAYNFSTFTGFERGSALAENGQTISFDYQASVDRGSLIIEWQAPGGDILWRKNLTESDSGLDELKIESPGKYTVIIQGKNAAGDFDVSWQVK